MEPIPLAKPDLGPDEEAEVLSVLRTGRLALGPRTLDFERGFADHTGHAWAAAVSSGTAGLHLAVRAAGIGPEDCVVTQSFSFIASANCIRYEGGEPVFLDVDPSTLSLSPDLLAAYLDGCKEDRGGLRDPVTGRRVAAVLPVDVFGHPADWNAILDVARRWELPVVADSCEAVGSRFQRPDGSWVHTGTGAQAAVYAFYPNKQITTGEGGMVVGDDPDVEERVRSMRNQGRRTGDPWLRHTRLGFNYRIDELSAALGVAQLRRIDEILARRGLVAAWYDQALEGIPELAVPGGAEWADPAWFVYFLRVDPGVDRDRLVEHLNARGVESKAYFEPAIHRQPPYASRDDLVPFPLAETEAASSRIMIVPFYSTMTQEQVERVASTLREGIPLARRPA
ncbi:MAG: DegT/DnrJ/EryC1/StrS family aminotransferase [Actinobacteria bacterium]|nr:DegT/DnrJ/EryC1/StrS family aminotransferase [Actinomycetota bacterium]